jgi:hypothetical protein
MIKPRDLLAQILRSPLLASPEGLPGPGLLNNSTFCWKNKRIAGSAFGRHFRLVV